MGAMCASTQRGEVQYDSLPLEARCAPPTSPQRARRASSRRPSVARLVSAAVCVQSTLFVLARTHLECSVCDPFVLMIAEAIKASVSLAFLASYVTGDERGRAAGAVAAEALEGAHLVLLPTLLFAAMNAASLWAARHLAATTFVVVSQLKLAWTALFSFALLGRRIGRTRLSALLAVAIGCAGVAQLGAAPRDAAAPHADLLAPLALCVLVLETGASGFCTSLLQLLFDDSTAQMWRRNAQMGVLSSLLFGALAWREGCLLPLERAADPAALTLALLAAAGGVLVALAIVLAGATEKAVSTTFAVMLTALAEHACILRRAPTTQMALHVLSAVNGVALYSLTADEARQK